MAEICQKPSENYSDSELKMSKILKTTHCGLGHKALRPIPVLVISLPDVVEPSTCTVYPCGWKAAELIHDTDFTSVSVFVQMVSKTKAEEVRAAAAASNPLFFGSGADFHAWRNA